MRFFSIVRFYILKNQGLSLHVPQHVLRVLIPMFVLFARAASFFNASLKTQEKFGLQLRSVPASCYFTVSNKKLHQHLKKVFFFAKQKDRLAPTDVSLASLSCGFAPLCHKYGFFITELLLFHYEFLPVFFQKIHKFDDLEQTYHTSN